jgi:hypothetical protein
VPAGHLLQAHFFDLTANAAAIGFYNSISPWYIKSLNLGIFAILL